MMNDLTGQPLKLEDIERLEKMFKKLFIFPITKIPPELAVEAVTIFHALRELKELKK